MSRVLLFRVLTLPLLLIGVSLLVFVISQALPSDPARLAAGDDAPVAVVNQIRAELGLDQPLPVQYFRYLDRIVHGDLGESTRFQVPVRDLLFAAFPATFELIIAGELIAIAIGVPLGLLAGAFRNSWVDTLARSVGILGMSTPAFFLGILLILVFAFQFGWFPTSGRGDPPDLPHLVLPALVLGWRAAGSTTRLLRASMIDVLHQDYIRSARARGIAERVVIAKYAFRNAMIPAVTDLGVDFSNMLGATVLVETVFAWPGLGYQVFLGIHWNDFPLLSGALIVLVAYVIVVNVLLDALYGFIDPRIRVG